MGCETIIINLKHLGESKIISVNSRTSIDELQIQVTSKWHDLIDVSLSFRYSIGSVNCSIDTDLDLRNLITLCDLTSTKIVNVDIFKIVSKQPVIDADDGLGHAHLHGHMNENISMHVLDSDSDCDEFDSDHDMHDNMNTGGELNSDCDEFDNLCDTDQGVHCDGNNFRDSSMHDEVDGDDFDSGLNFKENGDGRSDFPSKSSRIPRRSVKNNGGSGHVDDFEGLGSMPSYDVCPNVKKKPLLSDPWSHILDSGVGTVFKEGANEFRTELIKYSQQMRFRFKYTKNDKRYIYAMCSEWEDCACQWFIKAKLQPVTNAFVVTKANLVHTCIGKIVGNNNRRIGAKIIGNLIVQEVRTKPHSRGKDIMSTLQHSYGIHVPYWKAYKTYGAAMNQIFGSYSESYDQLRWYCDAVQRTNPGSVVSLESNKKTNRFERVFIAFKACLDGFKNCRPLLFIDGTFMTGRAKGTLLEATAKDGNNEVFITKFIDKLKGVGVDLVQGIGLFPVAIAIVSAEDKENWMWFLEKLRDFAKHDLEICYISDRNTGLMVAFPLVFVKPLHFFCMWHLLTNLRGRFTKGWTNADRENIGAHFKDCAYAPNLRIFNEKLEIFKEVGGKVAEEWIDQLPREKWAVAYSLHIKRYGEMTSNAAEQFNAWIKEARSLPITHMIDHIRAGISNWIVERRQKSIKWNGALCARKEKLWNILIDMSRSWTVVQCPGSEFEVLSYPSAKVDLDKRTCSCYQWQVRGFPCVHAAVVICRKCPTVYNIVEDCFLTRTYRACYSYDIHPILESEKFEFQPNDITKAKILPPVLNRRPGRQREKRKPSFGEWRRKKPMATCHRCGYMANHNPTTCFLQSDKDAF